MLVSDDTADVETPDQGNPSLGGLLVPWTPFTPPLKDSLVEGVTGELLRGDTGDENEAGSNENAETSGDTGANGDDGANGAFGAN